jgi:DNA (cytosine-5)-methyltransferase 1
MKKTITSTLPRISAVDLFCGVGGLTHGLVRGGVHVVAGVDVDPSCRYPFEANNSAIFVERDVEDLEVSELEKFYEGSDITLLAGCAPCQPFSTYSRSGRNRQYESQWPLVLAFGRLVEQLKPHLVTMENVPQLLNHGVFDQFLRSLQDYRKWWAIVDCTSFGVPQTRKRLVLLASRLSGDSLGLPVGEDFKTTTRQAIGNLAPVSAGERDSSDALHVASSLSEINMRRIRASKPGGTWRDWPAELQAVCHRKTSGSTYPSVYGRMEWDKPAPTITTQCFGYGNGRFGHPEQDRAISLREAAILQTFPPDYRFAPEGTKIKFNRMGRLIGNAVPVRLGEVIAKSLIAHVQDSHHRNYHRN